MVNNDNSLELNGRGEDGDKWLYYGYILKVKSIELAFKLDVGCEIKRNLKDKIFDPQTERMELLLVDWEEYGRNRLQGSITIATNSCAFHICTTDGQIKILQARTNYYFATVIIIFIRAVHKHWIFCPSIW